MMTGSDMECDSISAKTLTASSTDGSSDKGDSSRSSVLQDESYQPSIFVRIFVAEFNIQKCLQFPPTTPIWEVKQRLFATLPKELKDSANFGLFYPPFNGRAGKFLDDERELKDYPMPGHVGYLELKYKRRVYKMMNLDEKVLKQLHTKTNLRKFIDYVLNGQCEKITKFCNKGLDPNFHDLDNGETPLTLATTLKEPVPILVALINGGAHLDFRALDGCTPLHRAAQQNNFKALQGLLELGSSANYKDTKGLTPLYYSVTHSNNPSLCELLLHDYAQPGAVDSQGSQEIHQACRNGCVRHLEHLIFYGADIDARNASGNTPLHVCAVNNQESCARVLLFRGADKHAKNYANQTPYHVAVIAGASILADVIKIHSSKDIVPLREKPSYNPRRRRRSQSPSSTISRAGSVSRLSSQSPSFSHAGGPLLLASPSPSSRSYANFSGGSGSVSSHGSENPSQPSDDCSTSGVVTDKSSCSDDSTCTPSSASMVSTSHRLSRQHHHHQPHQPIRNDRLSIYSLGARSDTASVKSGLVRRADSAFFTDSAPHSRDVSLERQRVGVPRTVTLARGPQGFGFVLRGSKHGNVASSRDMQVAPAENSPALQYLDEVDRGGPADLAGLRSGDFLLSISGEDVRTYPHERAVNLIRVAQHSVTLTVLTCPSLPVRSSNYSSSSSLVSKPHLKGVPPPPRRDPRTSLTIGPERSKSYIGLNDIGSAYDTVSGEAKIASIRARPSSRRITAVEIEELMERTNAGTVAGGGASSLSSFTPLPKSADTWTPNGTASRVFSSVAHMKRQRAAIQQQRRKTDVVSTAALHKDYHSTPDLSAEGDDLRLSGDEDEEELYSDTMYRPPVDLYQNAKLTFANEPPHGVPLSRQQSHYQNGYHDARRESNQRNVPTMPQQNGGAGYARPNFVSAEKPPLPPVNRPQQSHMTNKPSDRASAPQSLSMKPSYSLDERTYSHMTIAAHVHEPPTYAAPDDPEPDYFSDEDRMSYSSSGRGASVTSSVPSTPAFNKAQTGPGARPAVQRMMSLPPPPPPPPVTTATAASSFAAAIAKAAQTRRESAEAKSHMPQVTGKLGNATGSGGSATTVTRGTTGLATGKPVNGTCTNGAVSNGTGHGGNATNVTMAKSGTVTPVNVTRATIEAPAPPPAPVQNDFQSELLRAIQRRSQEKDISDSRRSSSSTDVDALSANATEPGQPLASVKDRIVFLERQRVTPGAVKAVRISGITTDQSSTDADLCEGKSGADLSSAGRSVGVTIRAGVHAVAKSATCHNTTSNTTTTPLGCGEIDEGTAARFGVQYRSVSGAGYLRDHDSASINSQSSASTLSSGYESPTLKYGSTGEHLWTTIPHANAPHGKKFTPGYEPVGISIAPPPEFS